jgi:hypothetical protein
MTLHANSCVIQMDRRISDYPDTFSNALSNASSIKAYHISNGFFVFDTNLRAVRAVGRVRHSSIVSKAIRLLLVSDNCVS